MLSISFFCANSFYNIIIIIIIFMKRVVLINLSPKNNIIKIMYLDDTHTKLMTF